MAPVSDNTGKGLLAPHTIKQSCARKGPFSYTTLRSSSQVGWNGVLSLFICDIDIYIDIYTIFININHRHTALFYRTCTYLHHGFQCQPLRAQGGKEAQAGSRNLCHRIWHPPNITQQKGKWKGFRRLHPTNLPLNTIERRGHSCKSPVPSFCEVTVQSRKAGSSVHCGRAWAEERTGQYVTSLPSQL